MPVSEASLRFRSPVLQGSAGRKRAGLYALHEAKAKAQLPWFVSVSCQDSLGAASPKKHEWYYYYYYYSCYC